MQRNVFLYFLLCASFMVNAADSSNIPLLTPSSSDVEIAHFFKEVVGHRKIKFVYYFDVRDEGLFKDVASIEENSKKLTTLLPQAAAAQKLVNLFHIHAKKPNHQMRELYSVYAKQAYALFRRTDKLIDAKTDSATFAYSVELQWPKGGDVEIGDFKGPGNRELITFEITLSYAPIPDNWLITMQKALANFGFKDKDFRAYEEEVFPILIKMQKTMLNFAKVNAIALAKIFNHGEQKNGILFINDKDHKGFLENAIILYETLADAHIKTKSRFLHDKELGKKLSEYFNTESISTCDCSSEIELSYKQKPQKASE